MTPDEPLRPLWRLLAALDRLAPAEQDLAAGLWPSIEQRERAIRRAVAIPAERPREMVMR